METKKKEEEKRTEKYVTQTVGRVTTGRMVSQTEEEAKAEVEHERAKQFEADEREKDDLAKHKGRTEAEILSGAPIKIEIAGEKYSVPYLPYDKEEEFLVLYEPFVKANMKLIEAVKTRKVTEYLTEDETTFALSKSRELVKFFFLYWFMSGKITEEEIAAIKSKATRPELEAAAQKIMEVVSPLQVSRSLLI